MEDLIRNPKQKRAIKKKEKIIDEGFNLICENGYHNTNTLLIAKRAGVSTGIVYSYFTDKHDILLEGLKRFANSIFYPSVDFINESQQLLSNHFEVSKCVFYWLPSFIWTRV